MPSWQLRKQRQSLHYHRHTVSIAIKTSKPCSEKQRRFLEEKFTICETKGRKLHPVIVARQMRVTRGSDGQRQFTREELLSANQFQGFFSRRAKSKNQAMVEAEDHFVAAEVEDAMASVRNEVIKPNATHSSSKATIFVILLLRERCVSLQYPFYETFVATLN